MTARRLTGGGLWKYYVGFAIARIATIVVLPIVAHSLGPESYGYFEATVSVMLAAMIVGDAGLGAAMVRFADEEGTRGPLLRAAIQVQLMASAAAFVLAAAPMILLSAPGTAAATVLIALAAFALVEGFGAMGAGILRGDEANGAYLVLAFVRLITAAAVGALGAQLGGVGGALFGVALAGTGFAFIAVTAALSSAQAERPLIAAARRRLIAYSAPLMLTTLTIWTLSLSDRIYLRALSSAGELAQYAASYRTGSVVALFVSAPLALAWIPYARRAHVRTARTPLTGRWSIALAWISLGGGCLLVAGSKLAVPVIFGSAFVARPGVVAAVVACGWLSGLYVLVATEVFLADSTKALAPVMLGIAAFNLLLNAPLVATWDGDGAAVATLVSYAALPAATALMVSRESLAWLTTISHVAILALLLAAVGASAIHPLMAIPLMGAAAGLTRASLGRSRGC